MIEEEHNEEINQQLELLKEGDDGKKQPVRMANNEFEGISGDIVAIDADPAVLRLTVKVAVLKAYIHTQRKATASELKLLIDDLKAEILRVFPRIRLGEIGLAIHKVAMGEFEKVYNLSMAFMVAGIRWYMQSEARAEAGRKLLASSSQLLLEAPKPSPEDLEKMHIQNVKKAFDNFKKNGYVQDHGNYIFNVLCNMGVVNFTEEDKIEFWKNAKQNVFKYYSRPTIDIDRAKENRQIIEALKANREHTLFWVEAKKIALNKFFHDMVEMDTDISDLINA